MAEIRQSFFDVASVLPSLSVASGAAAVLEAFKIKGQTVTITGSTGIATAGGFNYAEIAQPTYSAASALAITHAATLSIAGAPIASGAGPATITNPYAFWVRSGATRLDAKVGIYAPPSTAADLYIERSQNNATGIFVSNVSSGGVATASILLGNSTAFGAVGANSFMQMACMGTAATFGNALTAGCGFIYHGGTTGNLVINEVSNSIVFCTTASPAPAMAITNPGNLVMGPALAIPSDVASSKMRVDTSKTVASATSAVWDGVDFMASTLTLSGSTAITTATGVNAHVFRAPTLSAGTAMTVTNAATVVITGAPSGAGAGPATITNSYAVWVQAGAVRFDGLGSTGLVKNTNVGALSIAVSGTDYEPALTFSTGLSRSVNTITSDLSTGKNVANQSAVGGTLTTQTLTLKANTVDDMATVIGKTSQMTTSTVAGADMVSSWANLSNTATSRSVVVSQVAGASADDAVFQTIVNGVTTWTFGIDNSTTVNEVDHFVIARASTLGTGRDILSVFGSGAGTGSILQLGNSAQTGSTEMRISGQSAANLAQTFFINDVLQSQWVQFSTSRLSMYFSAESFAGYVATGNITMGPSTVADVASTKLRVDVSKTVASATSAIWDGADYMAATLTLSGSTAITTATGVNAYVFRAPTISAASALTVTNAATVSISGAPAGAGAGPATLTNVYALWVQAGATRFPKTPAAAPTIFGDPLGVSGTGYPHQLELGNTSGVCSVRVGQDATHNMGYTWAYNATPANGVAIFDTYGYANPIKIDASIVQLQSIASGNVQLALAGGNVLVGTATDVLSTKLRVDVSKTVASATSAVWDGTDYMAATLTLSGSTAITTAAGVNAYIFRAPTISAASALTVTNAATVSISGAPVAAGAGPTTITNSYALWVQAGSSRFDTKLGVNIKPTADFHIGNAVGSTMQMTHSGAVNEAQLRLLNNNSTASLFLQSSGSTNAGTTFGITEASTVRISSSAGTFLLGTTAAVNLVVGSNNLEVMRVTGANQNVLLGTTTDVASTKLRVDVSKTVASATSAIWDGGDHMAATLTLSGSTAITTTTGVNAHVFRAPTISAASALTVTNAATVSITGAPAGAGAGPATLTNSYALWVQGGTTRFDGRVQDAKGADVASAATLTLGTDGNTFTVTGTTNIDFITTTGYSVGARILLIFTGILDVHHNTASPPANTAAIFTTSSSTLTTSTSFNGTIAEFLFTGTDWRMLWRKL